MRLLITGATGLVGARLCQQLKQAGHTVTILSRSKDKGRRLGVAAVAWQPEQELPPAAALADVEVVVHLVGEPIAAGRWTAEQKRRIRDSRVVSTQNLVAGIRAAEIKPRSFICASAIGFYGNRGDEELTETSPAGTGFLSEICQEWEHAAVAVEAFGVRVVQARIGVVLAREGGALTPMLPIFKLGLGGSLGSGQQWFPWIHLDDVVGLLQHAIFAETMRGPLNTVAPGIVTNAGFTAALAAALHRPALFAVPSFALRLGLGEMADLLLGSTRVIPAVAVATGYQFKFPELPAALANLFSPANSDTQP